MPAIEVSEEIFQIAQDRAKSNGFASVSDYLDDLLLRRMDDDGEVVFTPERLQRIDASVAEANAGHVVTIEQAQADLAAFREAWLREHGR